MAPIKKAELDDHQRFVYMKFKRSLADVLKPHHDEAYLLRWLRARNWNPEAAAKMLRQSLKWREQLEVDGALKTWQPPEVITLYHPSGVSGYDRDGCPIIIVPFAGLDPVGILHSAPKQDLIKFTVQLLEKYLDLSIETGARQVIAIFDMEGFNLRQYAWRPAAEMVVSLLQIYEANYPEILKTCYIVNAPRVFAIAFNVVKRFLNELTIGKILIYKNDPKKWKKAILEHIDPDSIPMHFGGNLCDPDGNPRYTTVIKQGGKVPKSYYRKKFDSNVESQYTSVVVKKGDKLSLDFIIAEKGSYLRWDFRTEEHDIRFGITSKDEEGNKNIQIKHRRVAAHKSDETGVIECQAPATYTVTFDNTYSVMRSKKLHYHIQVTMPLEKIDILETNHNEEKDCSIQKNFIPQQAVETC